jgi:hypothetical protein
MKFHQNYNENFIVNLIQLPIVPCPFQHKFVE